MSIVRGKKVSTKKYNILAIDKKKWYNKNVSVKINKKRSQNLKEIESVFVYKG